MSLKCDYCGVEINAHWLISDDFFHSFSWKYQSTLLTSTYAYFNHRNSELTRTNFSDNYSGYTVVTVLLLTILDNWIQEPRSYRPCFVVIGGKQQDLDWNTSLNTHKSYWTLNMNSIMSPMNIL